MVIADLEKERELDAEYGPRTQRPSVWFMWDNHAFSKIDGDAVEMGMQIINLMQRDHWCGYLAVRAFRDGPTVSELSFHGDYRNPANTIKRVGEWIEQIAQAFPSTASKKD